MTFEKAFESIKKKFEGADAKDVNDFALQITMSDEDCGGTFYVAVKDGVLAVEPYDYKDNDAVLDISKSDLLALIAGRKGVDKVIDSGASIKGSAAVIDSMKAVLKTVKKEAKKETAKAEPAKEEIKPAAAKKAAKAEPAKKETKPAAAKKPGRKPGPKPKKTTK